MHLKKMNIKNDTSNSCFKMKKREHLCILNFKWSRPFPLRKNAINKRLYDFVPYIT